MNELGPINECLEANAWYNSLTRRLAATCQMPSRIADRMHTVIAEAYLMRCETLTKLDSEK